MSTPIPSSREEISPVVFRVWRVRPPRKQPYHGFGNTVIALFPDTDANGDGRYVDSYEHIGQHGGADYHGVMAVTRRATPAEYASLKRELESAPYFYRLSIRHRRSHR